jgi:ABC-type branched-subunit amino acid transport system ATPase component
MTLLVGTGLSCSFGGVRALQDLDVRVAGGEVVALIGPNGAGKTTLFNCLAGTVALDAGRVLLDDVDITDLPPERRARQGIGRTFQRLEVFDSMSVADNLRLGAESRASGSLLRGVLGLPEPRTAEVEDVVAHVADELGLLDVMDQAAGSLSTGLQRRVELARALAGRPQVLLLDEPASGLDTQESAELGRVLRGLAGEGLAVLLVEHDVRLVLDTADRVYAMATGKLVAEGTPAQISEDPAVRAVYLSRAGEVA